MALTGKEARTGTVRACNDGQSRRGTITRSITGKGVSSLSHVTVAVSALGNKPPGPPKGATDCSKRQAKGKKEDLSRKEDGILSETGKPLKRQLDFNFENEEHEEWSDVAQDGLGSPFTYGTHKGYHVGVEMPWCFNLVWRPPGDMHFIGAELVVAAYIFSEDLKNTPEILVDDDHCKGNRNALCSLVPGEEVMGDVIDLVAGKLSHEKDSLRWFLPTIFARMAIDPDGYDAATATVDYMRTRYMGYVKDVSKTRMRLALDLLMGKHNPKATEIKEVAIATWDKKVGLAAGKLRGKIGPVGKNREPNPGMSF
ncbi:hypothetical protein PIB30_060505 [Stylosanthes scabra]|uniref:Uncharacterized protein n=1 Tax=Stylosanthes scabra TaxID=79078 RepID=A0ABU6YKW2_9FABA|nr:hypothetical protein [Stylosanthes scabra]